MQASTISGLVDKAVDLATPFIGVLITLALLFFIYGVIQFISSAGDESKRTEAKATISWGILALFVMVSVWGLVYFISDSLGLREGAVNSSGFVE